MIYQTRLKELRKSRGLTIRQLAELSGVSRSAISEIERNEIDLKVSTLVNLAKFFNCNLEDIINY
ncbi:MAG: helix-turn-helix transcriptional regulator [Ruminococcus sp.]|nr:helix-turn-helix transcriptional regulator [Ruminococcus sp.]